MPGFRSTYGCESDAIGALGCTKSTEVVRRSRLQARVDGTLQRRESLCIRHRQVPEAEGGADLQVPAAASATPRAHAELDSGVKLFRYAVTAAVFTLLW
jgi:hypothetical protein